MIHNQEMWEPLSWRLAIQIKNVLIEDYYGYIYVSAWLG